MEPLQPRKASEESYWWFVSSRRFVFELISNLNIDETSKILDIGCSSGGLMDILVKWLGAKNIYGIDNNHSQLEKCKEKGIKNVMLMDGAKTSFQNRQFDVVVASDVLEHIENDKLALLEWYRILKPGGFLILFVPAFKFLWSCNDELNNHYRRYHKKELVEKLSKTSFKINRLSYWNSTLFFPICLFRGIENLFFRNKIKKREQLYEINPLCNKVLILVLRIENFILHKINLPFGVSLFAICKKGR